MSDEQVDLLEVVGRDLLGDAPTVTPGAHGRRSVIVGTMTGGQGKSLISQLMAMVAIGQKLPMRVVAMDAVNPHSDDGKMAKLHIALSPKKLKLNNVTVETLPLEAENEKKAFFVPRNVNAQIEKLGGALIKDDCLVDLGANLVDRILDWIDTADTDGALLGGADITLVIPVTNEMVSIQRAVDTLTKLRTIKAHHIEPVLVLNEVLGEFPNPKANNGFQSLLNLLDELGGRKVVLSHCLAYGLKVVSGLEGGLLGVVRQPAADYQKLMKARSIFEASTDLAELVKWTKESMVALFPVIIPAGFKTPQ